MDLWNRREVKATKGSLSNSNPYNPPMNRHVVPLIIASGMLGAHADPQAILTQDLKYNDKRVTKVEAGPQTPTSSKAVIVDSVVTRKEQYLVFEKGVYPLDEWKMDAAKEFLVTTGGSGLMAFELVKEIVIPIKTRLPVEAVLEVSDRAKGEVTVRLIDHAVEKYSIHPGKP